MANAIEQSGEHINHKGRYILIGIFLGILVTIAYVVIDGPITGSTVEEKVSRQKSFQPEETPPQAKKPFQGELELFNEEAITVEPGTNSVHKIMLNVDGKRNNLIKGSFVESAGYGITFYVFDHKNYNVYQAGRRATPYVSARRVKSCEFSFVPDHSGIYYFVFDNGYSISTNKAPVLSVVWTWQE